MKNDKQIPEKKDLKTLIKEYMAEYLGIEPEDISEDDSLRDDLHMRPVDITDFIETLSLKGIDTSQLNFDEIETFADLIEALEWGQDLK